MIPWILCGVLFTAVLVLTIKIILLHKSMDEIHMEFKEHLSMDTNTLILLSSHDTHAKRLASELNTQLRLLRRQRRKYLKGDRELKEAVANISHDLRTPLTAICGYLDLLENQKKSETVSRYLSFINNRVEALKQLTEELFCYSVILSTGGQIKREKLGAKAVLEESLAAFYPAFTERGIVPYVKMTEKTINWYSDKMALARVFSNILNNVLKYSDGDLTVELHENGSVLFINTAVGLDKVEVGKLFNRFFTVETARSATGLGLSIAKTLVEQLNGQIEARYQGNQFSICVELPLAEREFSEEV